MEWKSARVRELEAKMHYAPGCMRELEGDDKRAFVNAIRADAGRLMGKFFKSESVYSTVRDKDVQKKMMFWIKQVFVNDHGVVEAYGPTVSVDSLGEVLVASIGGCGYVNGDWGDDLVEIDKTEFFEAYRSALGILHAGV